MSANVRSTKKIAVPLRVNPQSAPEDQLRSIVAFLESLHRDILNIKYRLDKLEKTIDSDYFKQSYQLYQELRRLLQ